MILYLIRHAWAGDPDIAQWPDDCRRPLTKDGRERFAEAVQALVQRGFAPERIATSPLVRCRQTAEIVARFAPKQPEVVERDELQPGSDLGRILRWTCKRAVDCEEIAWVGHAPDVGLMAAALIGDENASIRFAKGAVASIRFDGPPIVGGGELCWLATAKMLGC